MAASSCSPKAPRKQCEPSSKQCARASAATSPRSTSRPECRADVRPTSRSSGEFRGDFIGGGEAMSKEAFENAVAALVEATRPGKANVPAATAANRTLLDECDDLDQPALNLALAQLAEGLAMRGVEHPALLATACAAL